MNLHADIRHFVRLCVVPTVGSEPSNRVPTRSVGLQIEARQIAKSKHFSFLQVVFLRFISGLIYDRVFG